MVLAPDRVGIEDQLVAIFRELERRSPLQLLQLLMLLRPREPKAQADRVSAL